MAYAPSPHSEASVVFPVAPAPGPRKVRGMSHSPEDPEADRRALQLRLRRIGGQLKGIEAMIEKDYDCAEVLNQIVSAKRALKSLAERIVNDHIEHCLEDAVATESGRKKLREVSLMLKRYVE